MDNNIEHIIKNYQYFELNEAQKILISEWAENSDEFEALKNTLLATDQFVESKKKDINPVIKQRLDVRFAEKHNQNRLAWYNKLWFFLWPSESPVFKRPLIQFAAICLIVVISIPFFPNVKKQQLAMNDVKTGEELIVEEELDSKSDNKSDAKLESDLPEEDAKAEQQPVIEDKIDLSENKIKEDESVEKTTEMMNNQGWELNEEKVSPTVETLSKSRLGALNDDSFAVKDQERRDTDSDKNDISVPALEQASVDRLANVNENYKKVDTKEILDLLTALY